MTDYQKYINALRKCAKEHENDRTSFAHIRVSDLCRDTANLLKEVGQEPTTRNCFGCKYSKDNHNASTEECHLCMWENQYAPKEPGWIPVSERLPEDKQEVLVTTYTTYDERVRTTWYQDKEHGFLCGLVKAWMPLPNPYKPPKSENEENLKPCPFCGSVNVKVYNKYGSYEYVKCDNCGVTTAADEHERVIKLWNTRCSQESDGRK